MADLFFTSSVQANFNYLLTYDSYGPVHNRFNRGECITWASGGDRALDTPGPLNGIERSECHLGQKVILCKGKWGESRAHTVV
jgi:hypothetical protein